MKNPNRAQRKDKTATSKAQAPKTAPKNGQGSASETQSSKQSPLNWADLSPCVKRLLFKIRQLPEPTQQRVIALIDSAILVIESAQKLGLSLDITFHPVAEPIQQANDKERDLLIKSLNEPLDRTSTAPVTISRRQPSALGEVQS